MLSAIDDDVLSWLLDRSDPSVSYQALKSLCDLTEDDPTVKEAEKRIMEYGYVREILDKQNEDGSFGVPERFYRDKYTGTVWTLIILADLCASGDDERIKKACEFVLEHSQEPLEGGFSYDQSKTTGRGLAGCVIPCLTGNMIRSLIKLGYIEDERIRLGIEGILKYQRSDDNEGIRPEGKIYERYPMCWGGHSCHMGIAKAFKALAAIPPEKRSLQINEKINEFSEYFLKHRIYQKSHDIGMISKPGWLKFGFPLMYQTDILELLDIFATLDIYDERLKDAVLIISGKKAKDGRWKLENTYNGKTLIDIETKGKPSKWVTLKALTILNKYSSFLKNGSI